MKITQETIKELSKNLGEPKWLLERRLTSFDAHANLGLQLYGIGIGADYTSLAYDQQDFSVSGVMVSAEGACVRHFDSAAKDPTDAELLQRYMSVDGTPFARRALALFTDGFVLRVGANASDLIELLISQEVPHAQTYIMIIVEPGVTTTILESCDAHILHNVVIDIVVQEDARLEYVSVQNVKRNAHLFAQRRVIIERNAQAHVIDVQLGAQSSLSYTFNELRGIGAQGMIKGIFIGEDDQLFDLNTVSNHQAPQTTSDILVKGVLSGYAHGIYRGLVKIDCSAGASTGYQQEDTLLLSPQAEINAVPDLEIATNDVRCSHGVTTTRINADRLFYAQSRGIDERNARRLFVQSHCSPVIASIEHEMVRDNLTQLIDDTFRSLSESL